MSLHKNLQYLKFYIENIRTIRGRCHKPQYVLVFFLVKNNNVNLPVIIQKYFKNFHFLKYSSKEFRFFTNLNLLSFISVQFIKRNSIMYLN